MSAKERVVTRYYLGGHSSMLPRGVEEKLSLLPGVRRKGVTVELLFGASNELVGTRIEATTIESVAKLSYDQIPAILATPGHVLHGPTKRLAAVASALMGQRRARGAFVLYDLTHGWVASEEGHIKKLERVAGRSGTSSSRNSPSPRTSGWPGTPSSTTSPCSSATTRRSGPRTAPV